MTVLGWHEAGEFVSLLAQCSCMHAGFLAAYLAHLRASLMRCGSSHQVASDVSRALRALLTAATAIASGNSGGVVVVEAVRRMLGTVVADSAPSTETYRIAQSILLAAAQ